MKRAVQGDQNEQISGGEASTVLGEPVNTVVLERRNGEIFHERPTQVKRQADQTTKFSEQ